MKFFYFLLTFSIPLYAQMQKAELDLTQVKETLQKERLGTLYISLNINLQGISFEDLKIPKIEFEKLVAESWMHWFEKKYPAPSLRILIADSTQQKKLEDTLLDDRLNESETKWLNIEFKLQQKKYEPSYQAYAFKLQGSLVLTDLYSKKVLLALDNLVVHEKVKLTAEEKFSTYLANYFYRYPMNNFNSISAKLGQSVWQKKAGTFHLASPALLHEIIPLVEERLQAYQVKILLDKLSQTQTSFTLFYQGDEKKMEGSLRTLNDLKLSENNKLSLGESLYDWTLNSGSMVPAN